MADSREQLLNVLRDAVSQDPVLVKRAEKNLELWESAPSFFATLQDIFCDASVNHNIRFLGGIYLKNGISRFWRRTAKSPISNEEKTVIRQKLLQAVDEPQNTLAELNSLIVARIARLDYPAQWPEVLPRLIEIIDESISVNINHSEILLYRSLQMLFSVLSELSTRLLSTGRKQFAEIAPRTFQSVAAAYNTFVDRTFVQLFSETPQGSLAGLEAVSICLKCIRILMIYGIRDFHKYDETKIFVEHSWQHLTKYMEILKPEFFQYITDDVREAWEKVVENYGTLYTSLQKSLPVSAALCPAWFNIINYYWQSVVTESDKVAELCETGQSNEQSVLSQFLLHGMLLVRDIIKNTSGQAERSLNEGEEELTYQAHQITCERFLKPGFAPACAEILVSKYMLLTPSDLEKWNDDPEGWANDVEAENWEFDLRACAEKTFETLLSRYQNELRPIISDLFDKFSIVSNRDQLLLKDAVYDAVGLGNRVLYGYLDFESYVSKRLSYDLSNKDTMFRIMRRRVAWMLGKWVNESISVDCRKQLYEALVQLLIDDEDVAVQLAAAHSLKLAVDDWDYDINIFLPYLEKTMASFLALLQKVEEPDTVMKIISELNTVIDRCGSHVIPFTSYIIDLLVPLWPRSQGEPLFQTLLVTTFTKISTILNEQSVQLYGLLLPMIEHCLNRQNEAHIYLLEDALSLWWILLQSAPASNPNLLALIPKATELLEYDTENVKKILWIIESYLLLDPRETIQRCGQVLFVRLGSFITDSKEEISSTITHIIDLAIRCLHIEDYDEMLMKSGLMNAVLWTFLQEKLYPYALMSYMCIPGRVALQDSNLALSIIQTVSHQYGSSLEEVLHKWIDKFDDMISPRSRKLTCMAFTELLGTNNPAARAIFPHLMTIWVNVGMSSDEDNLELASDIDCLEKSAEKERKTEDYQRDTVSTTDIISRIRQAFNDCQLQNGGELFINVDPAIIDQVKSLLS